MTEGNSIKSFHLRWNIIIIIIQPFSHSNDQLVHMHYVFRRDAIGYITMHIISVNLTNETVCCGSPFSTCSLFTFFFLLFAAKEF